MFPLTGLNVYPVTRTQAPQWPHVVPTEPAFPNARWEAHSLPLTFVFGNVGLEPRSLKKHRRDARRALLITS